MKKTITACFLAVLFLSGCSNWNVDENTHDKPYFTWVQFSMPDGTIIEGKPDECILYSDERVKVTINGETYHVHFLNAVLKS